MSDDDAGHGDRIPPYAEEAERGLLGSIWIDAQPEKVMGMALKAGLNSEAFYVPAHQALFAALQTMLADNLIVDLITVPEWLKARGELDRIGGVQAIEKIQEAVPTSAHAQHYIEIVKAKHKRRQMIRESQQVIERCYFGTEGEDEILSEALARFTDVGSDIFGKSRNNAEVFDVLMKNWQTAHDIRNSGMDHLPGIRTGYWRMDFLMGGLQPGLHFFGGKSSAGKTALIVNLMLYWGLGNSRMKDPPRPGLVIQLDDTHEDMVGRMVSILGEISLPQLTQGFAKRDKMKMVREEIGPQVSKLPIYIEEECEDVRAACALAKYYKASKKIEWLVIDYVQVLDADGNPRDDERQRLGKIAKYLKRLWKELRIPVLVVSQTSKFKDSEDNGRKADMSDLFGASELFHAATSVTILKKITDIPEQPVPETENNYTMKYAVAAHLCKNKHGPKDQINHFWMIPRYFTFHETSTYGKKTNKKQRTWEEDIQAGGLSDAE